ncbi:MAG: ABC-F family ATP-binding cassette domain-containing protein [Spirochaeta sp.]|jgi:ATP-binding cassette subfamily F protein 3|nr:ABC-F family ATP-binding cassette domain-containing protein [Spirochaeta sp.]
MLSASNVHVSYGAQEVLQEVSLTIDASTRAGLIGANGSGKTTLLRVLAGVEHPEAGTVIRARASTIDYLPQRSDVPLDKTLFDYAEEGYAADHTLVDQRQTAAETLRHNPEDTTTLARIADIDQHLELSGYYARTAHIGRVLSGLGFTDSDLQRPLREFSGGWRMRGALAKSLLTRPDILLLDEPTNYLDAEARLWLSSFLQEFSGGVLLVSHDRAFLDDTVSSIFELFNARLKRYTGDYTAYQRQRSAELDQLVAAWESQQREIKRQEEFIRRFRASATKARQVQSRVKALERLQLIELPEHLRPITISLPPAVHSGRTVLELTDVHKHYDELHVLDDIGFTLNRGQRLAVVGLNGAGKSTLLRLLSGTEEPDAGTIRTGSGVSSAYFAQDSADTLPAGTTILDYVRSFATDKAMPHVRDILGSFLFSGDSVEKPLDVLSGGERSRVAMAALLVRPANLLIMDEPTNHLDMQSQEVLAEALSRYEGTVIVVSHDRHFLRRVATDVLALWPSERSGDPVPARHWTFYPGPYNEFESARLGAVFLADATQPSRAEQTRSVNSESQRSNYLDQKTRRARSRRLERREEEILNRLEELEGDHASVQEELAEPENYRDGDRVQALQQRLFENEAERDRLHDEWETLEAQRDELETE